MKLSYSVLPYAPKTREIDAVLTTVICSSLGAQHTKENLSSLPVKKTIKMAKKVITVFLGLVFATAAIVALPVSLLLALVSFPLLVLFKTPKAFASFQLSKLLINFLLA